MVKVFFGVLCAASFLFGDSFINTFEYGEMLYKNPRGIGCDKCHGQFGEGGEVGSYTKNKKTIKIIAPKIVGVPFDVIKASLKFNKRRSVMPEYFLTDSEINALIYYLQKINTPTN